MREGLGPLAHRWSKIPLDENQIQRDGRESLIQYFDVWCQLGRNAFDCLIRVHEYYAGGGFIFADIENRVNEVVNLVRSRQPRFATQQRIQLTSSPLIQTQIA